MLARTSSPARPRIVNTRVGTQGFTFAGRAGDIYGRYLGYYFLNIAAWVAAAVVTFMAIGGTIETLGISSDEFLKLFGFACPSIDYTAPTDPRAPANTEPAVSVPVL